MTTLLHRLVAGVTGDLPPGDAVPDFAVLRRRDGEGLDVLTGRVVDVDLLADIPAPGPDRPVLALVPFRQVRERGFACHDDGAPLRCLVASRYERVGPDAAADALAALRAVDVVLTDQGFDVDDDAYAAIVKRVIVDEIGRGEGANFVVRRDLLARQPLPPARAALALLRRLLDGEPGAYWTFAVHAAGTTLVGATPERHVSVRGGEVVMNPISGTYRYPADTTDGPTEADLLRFLADPKENEELSMVVDEELKMMSAVCESGGRVLGPFLKPMSRLAHTEYELAGRTMHDVRDVLRATMFAATVTGSPVENACRVVSRYEGRGRGYYAATAALLTARPDGGTDLDSPILIRTASLGADGSVRIGVGATLVRHSVPETEVAETHAKVAGLLAAFGPRASATARPRFAPSPEVQRRLAARTAHLSQFWLDEQVDRPLPALAGRTALVVDAEDEWTAMLAHVLRRLGMRAEVVRWDDPTLLEPTAGNPGGRLGPADLVVSGPGPGDPRDLADPRIAWLHLLLADRLASGRPTLAVCLSHQVLAGLLGLRLGPLPAPYQGTQRQVRVFDRDVRVGFYNTFSAWTPPTAVGTDGRFTHRAGVEGSAVPATGEVLALRGPAFASVQFHLESILSADGVDLLGDLVNELLAGR